MSLQHEPRLQLTIRAIDDSPVIRYHINKQFAKLVKHSPRIQNCKVVISVEQKNRHKGKIYTVSVDLTLPGQMLVCKKRDLNLFVAIRNAFTTLEQNLVRHTMRKVIPIDKRKWVERSMSNDHPDLPNAS